MKANYKPIGNYINLVGERNKELQDLPLIGLSITKQFIPSIANTIGTDMSTYRTIYKNQFAYSAVTSRNGDKLTIALFKDLDKGLISQAYTPFEITDTNKLLPDYLMMWFSRPEFDRYARFKSHGSARELFSWDDLCDSIIPVPHPDKQKEIVKEYNTIVNRIALDNQLIKKLEETAQAIYKQWFVDFEFPNENGKPYKSNGGEMAESELGEIPKGWDYKIIRDFAGLKYGKMLDVSLFLEKGYPIFSGYGVRGYFTEYMYEEPQILVLCRGVSGTGEVKLSPPFAYITNLSIIVEADEAIVKKMFLFYFLKNGNLRSLDSGSAQSQITTGDLYAESVLVPSIKLQGHFNKVTEIIMKRKEFLKNEISLLENFQSLLLSKLATIEN
jgi:type I restriction enzyme S subunit